MDRGLPVRMRRMGSRPRRLPPPALTRSPRCLPPCGSLILMLVGSGVLLGLGNYYEIAAAVPMVALLVFGGAGVLLGALKRAVYEHATRVAGMRFTSAVCLVLAVSYAGKAVVLANRMDTFGPDGLVHQATSLLDAISMWNVVAAPVVSFVWIAYAFAAFVAFAGFYKELGEVVSRSTLIDVAISLFLVATLICARKAEEERIELLADVSTNAAARAVFEDPRTASSLPRWFPSTTTPSAHIRSRVVLATSSPTSNKKILRPAFRRATPTGVGFGNGRVLHGIPDNNPARTSAALRTSTAHRGRIWRRRADHS